MEQNQKPVKNRKGIKSASIAALFAALALAIAIPLNLLASRLDIVWDMTPSKIYKLSDTTRNYLDKLEQEGTQIDFYFLLDMDVLSTDTNSLALYHVLQQYAEYDNINFVDFEANEDPELAAELKEDGYRLSRGDMVIRCNGRSKHLKGNSMYRSNFITADDGSLVQDSAYFTGENYITGAIDAVVTGRDTAIYFLTGHGEKQISADYKTLNTNLSDRNYHAQELNLSIEEAVPEDAAIVILAGPQSDLTNDELRKLNNYLEQGGNVCFWMSPNEAEIRYKNIESILETFGLAMDYDIVAESDSAKHISGDPYTFRCNVVASEDELDLTSEILDIVKDGGIPFMSNTRSFYQYYNDGTTMDSSVTSGSLLQTIASTDALGNSTSTAIGEVYGGTNPSAQDIEGEVLDLAMYATSPRRNNCKIMVMGNAEFIDDVNVAQDYMLIPVNMMLSVFSWMYDSDLDMDMGIAEKERGYDTMVINSEKAANTANVTFAVVPLCIGLIGLGVWLGRRYS